LANLTLVGSGASAVHFALSALERGHRVVMVDVGRRPSETSTAPHSFLELKSQQPNPAATFLGRHYEGVVYPDLDAEFYGIPPQKAYVFEALQNAPLSLRGFAPLISFAQGGLAEAWTGGCYPFNESELQAFPFRYEELGPFYDLIAERIGISGRVDDLARFMPVHEHLQAPVRLDHHGKLLLERYEGRRARLQDTLRVHLGRARVAVLSRDHEGRSACRYLGRCLWGCPLGSLYTPSMSLAHCLDHEGFEYLGGHYAHHFRTDGNRRVRSLVVEPLDGSAAREIPVETLVLGAGALSSSRIVLESFYQERGERIVLNGLMDNRQVMVPFVNPSLIGQSAETESYQYNQLALGLEGERPEHYVHGLVTTLTTALLHPVVQNVPLDLHSSLFLYRNLHAALGLVNLNFHDTRRPSNQLTLDSSGRRLVIRYAPVAGEKRRIAHALKRLRRALWRLGCVVPPGMTHVRPMGASVHYAGTLPMSETPRRLAVSPECQSHDFDNLYLVDGASFPFLPAKNITFTLMANAARIAARAF